MLNILAHQRVIETFIPEVYSSEEELFDSNGKYLEEVQKYYDKYCKYYKKLLEKDQYELWILDFDLEFELDPDTKKPLISYEFLSKHGELQTFSWSLENLLNYMIWGINTDRINTQSMLVLTKNKELC